MRKQVGFNVITENVGGGEAGVPKQVLLQRIQQECPFNDGWEILSVNVGQVAAQTLFLVVSLVQYKEVPEAKASAK
jgi:hypothetical protein